MLTLRTARWGRRADVAVSLGLAAASATYLTLRPWPLGASDEGYYFYHAVRMLDGEALYRDVSELTTPLCIDLLALAFRLFGATMTTGRAVGAAIQSLLMVAIYAGARSVGAGPALAVAAALTHLAIAQPAWPYSTPHWLAVLFVCVLLLVALDRRRARTSAWIAVQGLLLGLLVATRQHAGAAMIAGLGLLALADARADDVWGPAPGLPLARCLAALAVMALVGAALVMCGHIVRAGAEPIINQLVVHPFTGYRAVNQYSWGDNALLAQAPFTRPVLLRYLPAVVAITALRAAVAWMSRRDRRLAETLLVLAVFGSCAIAFTLSLPDLIHIAMIMPVVLIVAAELVASMLRTAGGSGRIAETGAGLVLIAACVVQLERNFVGARARYPIMHDTAFGRLAFATQAEVADIERVRHAVDQSPARDLFCYPGYAALHLMIAARNPTRHDLIFPKYQSDEEIGRLIEALERRRVQNVVVLRPFFRADDPVAAYLAPRYHCSGDSLVLCERHDGGG